MAVQAAAVRVLVWRDLLRFFRQKSRVIGALVQPLIFWLVIGSGLEASFHAPGAEGVGYLRYFFPGVVMLVILFTCIFTTMSVIEDRHRGFLQAVLVSSATRTSLVLGKTLGGVAIALAQAAMFLALAPLAGYHFAEIDWVSAILVLTFTGVGLAAIGFAVAWWLDSTQGYHVIMSVLLIPLWIVSSAMFPRAAAPGWLGAVMRCNPLAYGVTGLRRALGGGTLAPALSVGGASRAVELVVTLAFALGAIMLAAWVSRTKEARP
jgi:daunorubicin resistance ABC transporter membrane protein